MVCTRRRVATATSHLLFGMGEALTCSCHRMGQGAPIRHPTWPKLKTEVVYWPAGTRHIRQPSRLPWQMLQLALPATIPATGDRRASGIRAQDACRHRRYLQHQPSQQAPDLRQAQPPAKPRDRLKAASLAIPDSSWEAGREAEVNIGAPQRRGDNTFSVPMQAQPLHWADWSEQARRVQMWMGNAAGAFPAPGNAMGHRQGSSATSFSSVMAMEHRHRNHRPLHRWV